MEEAADPLEEVLEALAVVVGKDKSICFSIAKHLRPNQAKSIRLKTVAI